jgi:hypothetical protein
VHHRTFKYNYGHTMMWWDRLAGTYKHPRDVRNFNASLEGKVQGGSDYTPPDYAPDSADYAADSPAHTDVTDVPLSSTHAPHAAPAAAAAASPSAAAPYPAVACGKKTE